MKLRIDIVPANEEEEIIIRTHEKSDKIRLIERALSGSLDSAEMILTLGDTEYYVPKDEILFFETSDNKVAAHTKDRMYYTKYKLFELERIMPASFLRISKSCILNVNAVRALSHSLTGSGCVMFQGTEKIVYVSRAYYKLLKDKIYHTRFCNS